MLEYFYNSLVPRLTPAFCIIGLGASEISGVTNRRDRHDGRHDRDVTEYLALSFSSYGLLHRVLSQAVGKLQARDKGLWTGKGLN